MKNHSTRNLWIDYLRSAITVLVVAHHASLSYTSFARFDKEAYINSTCPIVDTKRWIGLDIFQNFNDVFFMSLMFLIGGLFLIKSFDKKGLSQFLKDRFFRLFIPFLFLGTFFMLIAYWPSYYVAHQSLDLIAYIKDFFIIERWPVGPPWFIWVLFFFNFLFALLHAHFKNLSKKIHAYISHIGNTPLSFYFILLGITWILYVPMAYSIGAGVWTGIGPFDFQLSRILLYFGYFSVGILIGDTNFNIDLFSLNSRIVRNWWLWLLLSLLIYLILTVIPEPLKQIWKEGVINEFSAWMIYYAIYAASCTMSCLAFITTFRKLVHTERRWWTSLSDNAYLIYLIHYIFIIWCQFFLLKFNIPAFAKFSISFILALSLSWYVSHLLRKIKIVNRYL